MNTTSSFQSISNSNTRSPLALMRSITLQEWVTVAVMAAAMGVAYWAWTFLYEFLKPTLKPLGLKRALDGFWLMAPVLFGFIMRKLGLALFGSVVAAAVQSMITIWGMESLIYGAIQGIGAELIFALFLYRRWNWGVLLFAASTAAALSFGYDFLTHEQKNLSLWFNLMQFLVMMISSWVFAAYLSRYIAQRLLKTGLLDPFLISRDNLH